jgi:hypothetical protein
LVRCIRVILAGGRKIVNINRWAIIPLFLAASLMIALATRSEAGSKTKNFEYIATGGFEPTLFIFPDGNQGDSITLEGTSTFGPITVHEWATGSSAQTVFPPCTAPGGVPGSLSDFADSLEIITFKKTGDVLLQNLVSGTECAASSILTGAPPPAPFEGTLTVTNVGGTGKFAGATGTVTLNFAGQYLSCGNNGCVGFVQHREKGSITTP